MTAIPPGLEQVRLIVPVKRLGAAKTRLSSDPESRRSAAEQLLIRTLRITTACLAPAQVAVLTADPAVMRRAYSLGASVLTDAATDLNSALHVAVNELRHRHRQSTIVVLVADLPRLTPTELRLALTDATRSVVSRHVADHHGTGTTFVSIPPGTRLPMVFGEGSAQNFARLGSVLMTGAPRGLRTDLDTPTDPFQLEVNPEQMSGR